MRLADLDANFVKAIGASEIQEHVSREEADGVMFLCPKCYAVNNGPVGTHSVICWFVGRVPDDLFPRPGRWIPTGASLEDLSLTPSVFLTDTDEGACLWHGFVTNGDAA